ncbi:MAG TPA: pyridoxal phosphate-dependent aminotransferase [bacterium]|nr:pyridoxal phosphate-dependent aminotransferase [bacterium]
MVHVSERVRSLSEVGTVALGVRVAQLAAAGRDIVNLSVGAPDFETPAPVAEAAVEAIRRGDTRYSSAFGKPELREAIRLKFSQDNGLEYPNDQITIGAGAKHVILNLFLATLEPGDEVIIPAPYYSSYPDLVRLAAGRPVIAESSAGDGFKVRPQRLARAITRRTRWFVLNSPGNPAGAVYSKGELEALAAVLRPHAEIMILSDEIYEHCLYLDAPYVSFAALDGEMFGRTATVNGVSKTYGMTGWRIGFAGGPAALMKAATQVQGQSTTCPPSISQVAAAHALRGPQDIVRERRSILWRRRDDAAAVLGRVPGLSCAAPDGALYLYVDCSRLIGRRLNGREAVGDLEVAQFLLEEANVSAVPGAAFGMSPYLRMTFAVAPSAIDQAGRRLTAALAEIA